MIQTKSMDEETSVCPPRKQISERTHLRCLHCIPSERKLGGKGTPCCQCPLSVFVDSNSGHVIYQTKVWSSENNKARGKGARDRLQNLFSVATLTCRGGRRKCGGSRWRGWRWVAGGLVMVLLIWSLKLTPDQTQNLCVALPPRVG